MKTRSSLLSIGIFIACLSSAHSADIKDLTITGKVIANPCVLNVTSVVTLDIADTSNVYPSSSAGTHAAQSSSPVDINLSSCPVDMRYNAYIAGTADSVDNNSLAVEQSADAAQNVAIAFYENQNGNNTLIPVNTGTTTTQTVTTDGIGHVVLLAAVVKADYTKDVTPGRVTSNATVKINYL
ncbi:fimbrial protein [Citrobacter arsenatis]|uniref:fimbrial protein n=1 Tax=Citrobacter arsenatis TaxID=2546350 RepID=UPI00300DF3AC